MQRTAWLGAMVLIAAVGCGRPSAASRTPNPQQAQLLRAALVGASAAESDAPAAVPLEPTGLATLKGVFRLNGAAPANPALKVDKDVSVCAPGGKTIYSQEILAGSNGALANVLIFADGVDPSWVHESAAGKADEAAFDQKECIFLSHVFAVQSTQPIRILNSDPVGHNTNFAPQNNPPLNVSIAAAGSAVYTPVRAERQPFAVSCSIHPWMRAYMIFRDDGYFAVTGDDGSFEIPNLPAGVPLRFRVWHEKGASLADKAVSGSPGKWSRGGFELTLSDQETKEIEITIDVSALQ